MVFILSLYAATLACAKSQRIYYNTSRRFLDMIYGFVFLSFVVEKRFTFMWESISRFFVTAVKGILLY